jgi:tRNA threonylcarbamoyladenosine biosynthesis protein TsaB
VRILALDTATRATAVALAGAGPDVLEARDDPPSGRRPNHATRLLPLAAMLLERAQIDWADLEQIAVGIGPGTFTGLRIGVATARGLAQGLGIPLAGVSTLQSLALNASRHPEAGDIDSVVAVLDARRGEVFAAGWPMQALMDRRGTVLAPQALTPEALALQIGAIGSRVLAIGDGAVEFRQVLARTGALIPEDGSALHRVTAAGHCRLAVGQRGGPPDETLPEYLRLPDAEISRRATGRP